MEWSWRIWKKTGEGVQRSGSSSISSWNLNIETMMMGDSSVRRQLPSTTRPSSIARSLILSFPWQWLDSEGCNGKWLTMALPNTDRLWSMSRIVFQLGASVLALVPILHWRECSMYSEAVGTIHFVFRNHSITSNDQNNNQVSWNSPQKILEAVISSNPTDKPSSHLHYTTIRLIYPLHHLHNTSVLESAQHLILSSHKCYCHIRSLPTQ